MITVGFQELQEEFKRILLSRGMSFENAEIVSKMFAETTFDGVLSHGIVRFPKIIDNIDKGFIDINSKPECISKLGSFERWNGKRGLGNLNAKICMDRAIELAKENGIGCVALQNTNHWLRAGTYGWQAAEKGCVGICWGNTIPNMPVWGGKDSKIGNVPIIFAIPRKEGHVVLDISVSQYSYGQLETKRIKGEKLDVPGGYDNEGNLSCNPEEIEKSKRVLPIGFWKGSGLSMVLDFIGTILSGGNSSYRIGQLGEDTGQSQIFIAIDAESIAGQTYISEILNESIADIKNSELSEDSKGIYYPGEQSIANRKMNMKNGITIKKEIWERLEAL